MPKLIAFFVMRSEPSRKMNFPLIAKLVHTGEEHNPYRCESCATVKQRHATIGFKTLEQIAKEQLPRPECCRKCGVEI